MDTFIISVDFVCMASHGKIFSINISLIARNMYQEHRPASFAYKISSDVEEYEHEKVLYSGEDAAEMFLNRLQEDVEEIFEEYIKEPVQMNELTDEEIQSHLSLADTYGTTAYCPLLGGVRYREVQDFSSEIISKLI